MFLQGKDKSGIFDIHSRRGEKDELEKNSAPNWLCSTGQGLYLSFYTFNAQIFMLKFDDKWRFDSPDVIPPQVDQEFFQIITKLAKGEQTILEHFKKRLPEMCLQEVQVQVGHWVGKLHGYLSAPAGGGIRHGVHLADGVATTLNEAILYYTLQKVTSLIFWVNMRKLKMPMYPLIDFRLFEILNKP